MTSARKLIKLRYICRWCKEPFEGATEYLDMIVLYNRLHATHMCNEELYKKYSNDIRLQCGLGDLTGYTIMGDSA